MGKSSTMQALRGALTQTAPEEKAITALAAVTDEQPNRPPSRQGKVHLSGWFDPQYKTSIRAIQMQHPDKTTQDLLSEALNMLYAKYNVPFVRVK